MTSTRGAAAALAMILALPVAIASQLVVPDGAEVVLHLAIGIGCLLLAAAAFDFGLPRWVAWTGCLSAGAFGVIFVLQGIAGIVNSDGLDYLAYDILGQQLERVLPDLILVWFAGLVIWGSRGKTRILGAIVVTAIVAAEVASIAGAVLNLGLPSMKVLFLIPFVWLLIESVKPRQDAAEPGSEREPVVRETRATV